jgi:hypothetical protein
MVAARGTAGTAGERARSLREILAGIVRALPECVVRAHHPEEAPTWCELERDGTVLQFLSGETPWIDAPSFTGCFYVHCSDVDAVFEQIRDLVESNGASRIANGERASSCCAIQMDTL